MIAHDEVHIPVSYTHLAAFGAFTATSYETSRESKKILGYGAYVLNALGNLPASLSNHTKMKFIHDGVEEEGTFVFGAISNSPSVGGFKLPFYEDSTLDDGKFEVLLVAALDLSLIHIYPQLVSIIKRRIVMGVYPAGSKLPSVRELADESGVNPNTMQRALTGLEQEGLVYTQRTAGRFVSEDKSMLDGIKGEEAKSLTAEYYAKLKKLGYSKTQMIDFINMQGEE